MESEKARVLEKLLVHRDSLYAYVLACVRSHADADDILQNVSIAVIESEEAPEDDRQFLSWAREIARRRVLEYYRTSKRLLPAESRQLLAARYEASFSNMASLSRRFGRTEQGIVSLLYRIRQALRDCVERRMQREKA